jgi:hypothetical protein
MLGAVKMRREAATKELEQILDDLRAYPINYNHYYTETIEKCRMSREFQSLAACVENATTHTQLPECRLSHTPASIDLDRLRKDRVSKLIIGNGILRQVMKSTVV